VDRVSKIEECRKKATEALLASQRAISDEASQSFLQLAQLWRDLADHIEKAYETDPA